MAGAVPPSPSDDGNLATNLGVNHPSFLFPSDSHHRLSEHVSHLPSTQQTGPMTPAPAVGGMVQPAWHHRRLIELTASFVARHGPEFEKRMLPYNPSIARCEFFDPSHPYHAYYQHCLSQLRSNPAGPAMDARMTCGIDRPPRYMRKVIEITATSTVKYGHHHEKWITEVFGDRPTHKFLDPSHPYHAYYQHCLSQIRSNPAGPAMDARMTGGIDQPPRYMQKVIEITATSTVKYGLHHEKWITEVFGDRPTHKFLDPSHPYHAYYQQRITDARALLRSSSKK